MDAGKPANNNNEYAHDPDPHEISPTGHQPGRRLRHSTGTGHRGRRGQHRPRHRRFFHVAAVARQPSGQHAGVQPLLQPLHVDEAEHQLARWQGAGCRHRIHGGDSAPGLPQSAAGFWWPGGGLHWAALAQAGSLGVRLARHPRRYGRHHRRADHSLGHGPNPDPGRRAGNHRADRRIRGRSPGQHQQQLLHLQTAVLLHLAADRKTPRCR